MPRVTLWDEQDKLVDSIDFPGDLPCHFLMGKEGGNVDRVFWLAGSQLYADHRGVIINGACYVEGAPRCTCHEHRGRDHG